MKTNLPRSANQQTIIGLAVVAALVIQPILIPITYLLNVFVLFFIYSSLASCWDLVAGRLGQFNLGQASFFGIGGYTTGLLWLAGIHPAEGAVAGGLLAMIFAAAVSPLFRLRGMYFAVATLGMAEVLRIAMLNWYQVTGGAQGLYMPLPEQFSILPYYYISLVILSVTILGQRLYLRSRIGLALLAIREDEDAAEALGVNALKYKILTFMVSAFFVGITGGFYAYYLTYIEPNNLFGIVWSITPLFIVIIGGGGTFRGPLLGAGFYVLLSEVLVRFGTVAEVNMIIFGIVLIALMIFRPGGVNEVITRLLGKRP